MLYSITANVFNKGCNRRLTNRTALSEQKKRGGGVVLQTCIRISKRSLTRRRRLLSGRFQTEISNGINICLYIFLMETSNRASLAISRGPGCRLAIYFGGQSGVVSRPLVNPFLFIRPYFLLMRLITLQVQLTRLTKD